MKNLLKSFLRDESGASAAEYALILAIVGVAIGAAALGLGNEVQEAIEGAADNVHDCNNGGGTNCTAYTASGGGSSTSSTSSSSGGTTP